MRTIAWLPVLLSSTTLLLSSCGDDIPVVPPESSSTGGSTSATDGSTGGPTTTGDTVDPDSTGGSSSTGMTVDPDSTGGSSSSDGTESTGPVVECGDAVIEDGEQCDDGNPDDGDGCSAVCEVEPGFDCAGEPTVCTPICGDGLVVASEPCDDANADLGDGCDDTCAVEPGWACAGEPSVCMTGCGDGIIAGMEQCDDANMGDGDGCNAACVVEPGWSCGGEPSSCDTICGDGLVAGPELCDDGGVDPGDGCSATCDIEPGWACAGEPSACDTICGDGILLDTEQCDDGNVEADDGCTATCDVEPNWSCVGEPSACTTPCGDGLVLGPETCDDGAAFPDDGCDATCQTEPGWQCTGEPSLCVTVCGDGMLASTESCDDGNIAVGDGCTPLCGEEYGWGCVGSPSVCTETTLLDTVALGGVGGCVLTTLGEVACFGRNFQGEVGNGTTDIETFLPTLVLDDAIAITAGEEHNCAIRAAGDVWCWGDNNEDQMGPLAVTDLDEPLPIEVTGMPAAVAIEAGDDHTCIIDMAGAVWCWGDNNQRQLGRADSITDSPIPAVVPMPGDLAALDLGMGDDHSCAVLSNGTVACWGDDFYGQLGDGASGADNGNATLVPGLAGIVDVEGGQFTTCALTNLGEMYCWGHNGDGQLGNGNTTNDSNPQLVGLPSAAEVINLGDDYGCALMLNDEVYCWGEGEDFQLGSRDLVDQTTPLLVADLPPGDLVDLEAGGRGVCVVSALGERYCWGYGDEGQLGIAPQNQLSPSPVTFSGPLAELVLDPPEYRGVLCGVLQDGTVECAGEGALVSTSTVTGAAGYFEPISSHLDVPTTLPLLADVQTMRMGNDFACATTPASVLCWGDNSQRQLGQGGVSIADILTPTPVMGLGAVDELEVGGEHACVRIGGTVQCWGDNSDLQTGEPAATTDQSLPVTVMGLADAIDIALGEDHSCAVRATGVVSCWGNDINGQLGDDDGNIDDSGIPVDVTGLPPGVVSVVAGQDHSCALAGGQVYCWGNGQALGQGVNLSSDTALLVPGLAGIVRIDAGWNYNCALDGAGDLWCWGYALDGHLGNGGQLLTGLDYELSPVAFEVASGITDFVTGNSQTCIETIEGWSCVGFRATGQLGNGTTMEPVRPTATFFGM